MDIPTSLATVRVCVCVCVCVCVRARALQFYPDLTQEFMFRREHRVGGRF